MKKERDCQAISRISTDRFYSPVHPVSVSRYLMEAAVLIHHALRAMANRRKGGHAGVVNTKTVIACLHKTQVPHTDKAQCGITGVVVIEMGMDIDGRMGKLR